MNADILKNGASNNREIDTDSFKIYGNCLEVKDTVIQLSNVSLVANSPLILPKIPAWCIAFVVIGVICMFMQIDLVVLLGFLVCVIGCCGIYVWYRQVEHEKQLKKLVITTNSGQSFSVLFEQGEFLDKVINTLKEIIAHPGHHSDIIINIKDNTIAPGGSVIDSVNEFNTIGGPR